MSASRHNGEVIPLDESDLRRWRACARQHWLHRHGVSGVPMPPAAETSAEAQQALRASFAGARSVPVPSDEAGWDAAEALSRELLAEAQLRGEPGATVLGACLRSDDGARVRVDVLQRGEHGWRLWRLRVATVAGDDDVDALALWAHVVARAGWRLQSAGLLLIDTDFLYPGLGCYAGLLREVDAGPLLGSRPVGDWLRALRQGEQGSEPTMALGAPCTAGGGCRFQAHCHAGQPLATQADPRHALEHIGRERADTLRRQGHRDLLDLDPAQFDDPRLRRVVRAVQADRPWREAGLAALARDWPRPWRCLRIETIGLAVPVWAGTQPYQVLPCRWSLGEEAADGAWRWTHWLADGRSDPRSDCARALAEAVQGPGTLIAYQGGFERNRLRELARWQPALADAATGLVDLYALARRHAYHPAQCGAWSARAVYGAVLPADQVPRWTQPLARSAMHAYARLVGPGTSAQAQAELRAALQAHGERQVVALRGLLGWLLAGTDPAA